MPSEIIWGTMAGLFIAAVYLVNKVVKRGQTRPGATWMQQHVAVVGIGVLLIPFAIGLVLVNTVFGQATVVKKIQSKDSAVAKPEMMMMMPPPKPEPVLKLIISDGSKEADIAILNQCGYDEVTVVQNAVVTCVAQSSTQVTAWMSDLRLHEAELLRKYISHQKERPTLVRPATKRPPKTMQQGFLWLAPAAAPTTETKRKPLRDRHAELLYFLALVLGVLGKYFWDHYEDKKRGKDVKFEPHLIVMSFIIAALVYYSIQQGIEKEASKFTTRGVVFAFNSGFMWQTILTSMNRSRNGDTRVPAAEETPSA